MVGVAGPTPAAVHCDLVIITPHQEGIRREFAEAFSAWHQKHFGQPVFIDYRNFGGRQRHRPLLRGLARHALRHPGHLQDRPGLGRRRLPVRSPAQEARLSPGGAASTRRCMQARLPQARPRRACRCTTRSKPAARVVRHGPEQLRHRLQPRCAAGTWACPSRRPGRTWPTRAIAAGSCWPTRPAAPRPSRPYMIIVERAMADAAEQGRSEDDGWADGMGLIRQIAANARMFTDSCSVVPIIVSTRRRGRRHGDRLLRPLAGRCGGRAAHGLRRAGRRHHHQPRPDRRW